MKMKQRILLYAFHSPVDIQKRDLLRRLYDSSPACSSLYLDQPRVFQLGQDPADDDRIHIDTGRKKITGYLILLFKRLHTCQHMDRNGKSARYLHKTLSPSHNHRQLYAVLSQFILIQFFIYILEYIKNNSVKFPAVLF